MQCAAERTKAHVGKIQKVLIEGTSKKSEAQYCGRNSHNVMVVFPKKEGYAPGQYVMVKMMDCTSVTLIGEVVES
jgi:tRNA-2-methylthio-N6-dimethylallyladenosine synthase